MSAKYIFVTGGVVSSIGKGITVASIGRILKNRGFNISVIKLDPYLNVDPGTMSPYQHGEVFVTEDGGETDLDLGHYERFIDIQLNKNSNVTAGGWRNGKGSCDSLTSPHPDIGSGNSCGMAANLQPSPQGGIWAGGWWNNNNSYECFYTDIVGGLQIGQDYEIKFYQVFL